MVIGTLIMQPVVAPEKPRVRILFRRMDTSMGLVITQQGLFVVWAAISGCYSLSGSVYCDSTGQWSRDACKCEHSTTVNPEDSSSGGISVFGIIGIVLAICFLLSVIVGCRFYDKRRMSNNRSRNENMVPQRQTRNINTVDQVRMSQYQAARETQQTEGNTFFQGPPPYNEIALTKLDPLVQPPSYEEVTVHPLSFSTNLRGTNIWTRSCTYIWLFCLKLSQSNMTEAVLTNTRSRCLE